MTKEMKTSRAERRRNFQPRKWAQKWLRSSPLPPSTLAIPLMSLAEYDEYWKNYVMKCTRCGSVKVKYRLHFQDWCTWCFIMKNYDWKLEQMNKKIKEFYVKLANTLFKLAWYFQDRGTTT